MSEVLFCENFNKKSSLPNGRETKMHIYYKHLSKAERFFIDFSFNVKKLSISKIASKLKKINQLFQEK